MATSAKPRTSKPATSNDSVLRPAARRGTTTPSRRSESSGSQSLVRRVQANLPAAKRHAMPNPAESLAAALARATGEATARGPLTKDRLGILVAGAGAVTAATRQYNIGSNELPVTYSDHATNSGAGDTRRRRETIAGPSATTGGDHGDSQGPDPATAA